MLLPRIDFTALTKPIKLGFKWAYARSDANYSDELIVLVSNDCGTTWAQKFSRTGNALVSGPTQTTLFIPDSTQWKTATIDLSSYSTSNNVDIKLVNVTDGGNALYIDSLKLGDFDFSTLKDSVKEVGKQNTLLLFPNPAQDLLTIKLFPCNNNGSKENSNAAPEEHKHAEGVQHEHVEKALEKGNFQMQFSSSPQIIEAGKPTTLTFTPKNKDNTNESVPLDVEHEKKIHLIVVSEDLSWFSHIHPEYQADGSYSVTETFPNGGNYILYADYKPTGRSTQLEKIQVSVKGAAKKPVTYSEARLVSQVDGYEVKFVNGSELKANNEGHLIIKY